MSGGNRLLSSEENQALVGPARGERVRELVGEEPRPGVLGFPRVLMRLDLR